VSAPGRLVLVLVSPRVAPGLLTWPAWEQLRSAAVVLAVDLDDDWLEALAAAGVVPEIVGDEPPGVRARHLADAAADAAERGPVVWLGSPDGDPGLTDALAEELSRRAVAGSPPEIELVAGSHDVPGARLLDLVAVMDRLRSPGGCPWDARQTHLSLLPYLLEESHEVMEAVDTGDRDHLREELGDLLLQVMFHARIAQEDPRAPFGVDDVAAGIVAKLVSRHPHVFAGQTATDADQVAETWEELKAAEKRRTGLYEGIPASLPSLARGAKMLGRLERAGRLDEEGLGEAAAGDPWARELLALLVRARAAGADAESSLRAALTRLAEVEPQVGAVPADGVDTATG
jgi:NTP pyrophosphatase (non-canonical NTP hydrolase)